MSKTVVIGASPNSSRVSYLCVQRLVEKGIPVVPVGFRSGEISGVPILTGHPEVEDVHTVTMYVGAKNQPPLYDYIFSLQPKRVIFNPGAENSEFALKLKNDGVEVLNACNLVMLATGQF
jgi:predicted CoA-binding protein